MAMGFADTPPRPRNEPVLSHAPHSPERAALRAALSDLTATVRYCHQDLGGASATSSRATFEVRAPHNHELLLGHADEATDDDVRQAIDACLTAGPDWAAWSQADRSAVFLRAADMLSGPWRARLNAATILGQSKSVQQAEIDSACELIDFWRWNVHFAHHLDADQPTSPPGVWNRLEFRPLEGFVVAITPFNFTAIAGNLPTAPALMGNPVVWKPAPTQQLAASLTLDLLQAAGLPPGVITLVTGSGRAISSVALRHPALSGVHFTGSTATFRQIWATIGAEIERYRGFPRLVGETGGKDFVVAHASADVDSLVTALVRGAFEYQGQKCSAASRAYIPRDLWGQVRDSLVDHTRQLVVGDPANFSTFMGAVIDSRAFERLKAVLSEASVDPGLEILSGGTVSADVGWFVDPTIIVADDARHPLLAKELFGPVLTVHVYDDAAWPEVLATVDGTSAYALTGSVFATDRRAIRTATDALRQAAGNFYVNDKPTGAVVGQQPFGGTRQSGTNDKAGSALNLLRWVSARSIKETLVSPTEWRYPHQLAD